MTLKIVEKLTPHNHTKGRGGAKIQAVVWHVAEGGEAGVSSWFFNPASQASTHYLVCKDGRIIRYVREEDTPWANGKVSKPRMSNPVVARLVNSGVNLNRQTVSIETERYSGERLTAESPMGRALAALTRDVLTRYGLPLEDDYILGHNEIDSVDRPNCPGNLDWDGLLAAVKREAIAPVLREEEDEVREPRAGEVVTYLNARGEAITAINYGGSAATVEGFAVGDAGVTVRNDQGERYSRSVQGTFQPWQHHPKA